MRRLSALLIFVGVMLIASALRFSEVPAASAPLTAASAEATVATSTPAIRPTATTSSDMHAVIRVVDGDTVVVGINGTSTTLRLIGIDTPETVDPRKPVQCFGIEASNHAKELLAGASVRLEYDPSQGMRDKYGRTLAYIFLPDGTNFAEHMIAEGYAHEYTYNLPYKYQTALKAAEQAARDAKKGLWADAACAAQSARS